jgi:hypothetical protein
MKWYQRMGIILMFACLIECFFIFMVKPLSIGGIVGAIVFGVVGITLLMID